MQDFAYLPSAVVLPIALGLRLAALLPWVILLINMARVKFSMRRLERTLGAINGLRGVVHFVIILFLFSAGPGPRTSLDGVCAPPASDDALVLYIMYAAQRCARAIGRDALDHARVAVLQGPAELDLFDAPLGPHECQVQPRPQTAAAAAIMG